MARKTRQADTKVEELYQRLRAMALEKGPGAQLPTVRALCELLGTTRVTLREALTLLEAEQFIYTRDRQGIFVSPTIYHKAIHVIFSSNGFASPVSPVWGMLWMQLEQEAQARAALKNEICTFHLVKPTADPVYSIPPAIEAMLQTERVDGVLAIGFQSTGQGILHTAGFPCITFAGERVCASGSRSVTQAAVPQNWLVDLSICSLSPGKHARSTSISSTAPTPSATALPAGYTNAAPAQPASSTILSRTRLSASQRSL